MRLLIKNTLKKIRKSFGRFLSIIFIIALGISVFIGLRESTTGMLYTADNYYDENKLMDFRITSTHGLTDEDIIALKELKESYKVIPSYSLDVLVDGESIRIHSIESDINNVVLIDGKMPTNNNECLGDYYNYKIGDKITFKRKNLTDYVSIKSCNVVGTIKSPLYVRGEKGISSIGNGKLISFIYVNKSVFKMDYYTEVYLIAKESIKKNSYYEEYDNQIKMLRSELEEIKPIRETIRYEEILTTANNEIIKIKKELNNKIDKATTILDNTKEELDNSKLELENTKITTIKNFDNNYKSLNDSKNEIINNLNTMGIEVSSLNDYILTLNDNINNLKSNLNSLDESSDEYKSLSNQISELETKYDNLLTIRDNLSEIEMNLDSLEDSKAEFETEISKQESKINEGYTSYYKALADLEESKKEAEAKISTAKSALDDIEKPTWYLLDRTDNSGYVSYKEDIVKVDAIARILPIFFVIVVVLMVLNTLTRLIEEERTEIGILQANGFSRSNITISYLLYVSIAGLIGIMIGLTVGYSLIPKIIYGVFLSRYYVPKLITVVSPLPFSLVIAITLIIIIIVTVFACIKEFSELPATLLRPKSPKTGKKTIFERMKFIWSNLSFMWKVTIRNLFRYKKRIIMTILGVAGSTALLLAGLGINDSINTISKLQYKDIIKYDAMYILNNNVTSISNKLQTIFKENEVVNPLLINQTAYTYTFDNKIEDTYLVVPSIINSFNNYVTLKSTISNKLINIPDNGVLITKQMADNLKVTKGDLINIRNKDNELYILYVSDIVENYVSHYIYMSSNYYKEIFGSDITYNTIIADDKVSDKVALTDYNILMVNYTNDILKTFDSFVSGLNKIIIMIVVFACFLALIVLYNLTIINVSERKREIATFKVLGFNDKEIATFVYRETIILTVLGIILGLFLGIFLHRYVIYTAETDNIMFLKTIKPLSYVLSAIITIMFSFLVQLIINKTLKKIDMIDSLKSVE